ncbi:endonuclease domain-containing protein [Chiayiivirga flava]|uniref:UDP-N-acetyl-alpha-D-muramoyl-L-alanyl-L-glutamate epimerase n=1 Tax=Chiayiivirga flava TaxID=659595 RepID=A0A7W8DAF9_9GAMM|nr:endonuclease domain-containing protein [Chiayiivirga flava]MBB5209760.1 hypothetical protein [Chiayiivirga flava]
MSDAAVDAAVFRRDAIEAFRFVRRSFDAATGEAQLVYAFDDGVALVETLQFPGAPFVLDAARAAAVDRALGLLHLIAGVSYYKAAVPKTLRVESQPLDADLAALLVSLYENGLGEFAYRNGLSLRGNINFIGVDADSPSEVRSPQFHHTLSSSFPRMRESSASALLESATAKEQRQEEALDSRIRGNDEGRLREDGDGADFGAASNASAASATSATSATPATPATPAALLVPAAPSRDAQNNAAPHLALRSHALTAIGGGKDSLVSIETLRSLGIDQTVAWIGSAPLIRACAERTGLPQLNITRQLSPLLFEYNKQGAYNGHIPVTAVNSAILVLAALLHDADQVVFSNERSASYGSLIPGTGEVNHQWSKGWDFERDFARYVHAHIAADLQYYSLLRPLSELAVARQFAKLDRYDAHFSSCNRNFHLLGERPAQRWCGVCPKCHFVFLALAPFVPKPRLTAIFGRNLLDDAALAPAFDALIEYRDHKPFECVGEGRESRAALAALSQRTAWQEDAIVARFAREILPQLDPADLELAPLLAAQGEHGVPPALWNRVHATFAA